MTVSSRLVGLEKDLPFHPSQSPQMRLQPAVVPEIGTRVRQKGTRSMKDINHDDMIQIVQYLVLLHFLHSLLGDCAIL